MQIVLMGVKKALKWVGYPKPINVKIYKIYHTFIEHMQAFIFSTFVKYLLCIIWTDDMFYVHVHTHLSFKCLPI